MKERIGRRTAGLEAIGIAWGALLGGLLLLFLGACGPGGEVGLRPAGDASMGAPGASASPALGPPATSAEAPAPRRRPILLEPIVEDRPASANRSLGEEDLRNLGELGLLPHVVQSISTGAPCDFSDAMSNCQ